ncbi:cobalamin-binding protein [Puniceicoccaceae bacterium K14]|nr:cobalamin-binding protein [Puniceicoccaceae bacterium K14]
MNTPRIISLIASSTETLCALGFQHLLVGRSHECDYPISVSNLPACSSAKFDTNGTSSEIDDRVQNTLKEALSVYNVDIEKLQNLNPSLIITQDQCDICAVSLSDVQKAVDEKLQSNPAIISLAPNSIEDIFSGIKEIANALDEPQKGIDLVNSLSHRIEKIRSLTKTAMNKPKVACIEWIDPLIGAGNWIPEIVSSAGGVNTIGQTGRNALRLALSELERVDPEYIVAMPCGWGIEKARQEIDTLARQKFWPRLKAVKENKVFLADGNHFFNRPSPRIVESIEILAEILHPELFEQKHYESDWVRY